MHDRFHQKFDVQTSYIMYKSSNYVLRLIFVMNIKFPWATYHTMVPSTEELYCLNSAHALCHAHAFLSFNAYSLHYNIMDIQILGHFITEKLEN